MFYMIHYQYTKNLNIPVVDKIIEMSNIRLQGHQYLSLQFKVVMFRKLNKIFNFCKCYIAEKAIES